MTPTVVAAADGRVYLSDGSVYERCLPASSRGEWMEREPIPRTDRAREHERERQERSGPASGLPWLKEAS